MGPILFSELKLNFIFNVLFNRSSVLALPEIRGDAKIILGDILSYLLAKKINAFSETPGSNEASLSILKLSLKILEQRQNEESKAIHGSLQETTVPM